MNDRRVVAAQIEREPRSAIDVVARCPLGLPVVTKVPPHLDDGTPFPTTYWLTCPLAVRRIGRIEAEGGVKRAETRIANDPEFGDAFRRAMERYEADRDELVASDAPIHRPAGGVGGSRRGVKCLHAHYADHAAGNENPVGATTAAAIEPLDCSVACVAAVGAEVVRNPDWVEPSPHRGRHPAHRPTAATADTTLRYRTDPPGSETPGSKRSRREVPGAGLEP